MGAGLSGLACAITLEKHGITPVIFEKRSKVGDRFVNGEILLSILSRPIHDCLAYFSEEHGIFLQPSSNIKKLVVFSENEQAEITGHLGFCNLRGRDEESFENQLAKQVKSTIQYDSKYTYEQLLKDFTHVVVATGDAAYAAKIQNFREDLTVTLKGATVTGEFDRYTVCAWLDNNLAPKGYGYLIPLSEHEANIVIGYPDYPENQKTDLDLLWERFHQSAREKFNQPLEITDRFEITRYIMGLSQRSRIGNTFFTGNNFGALMPFLGFGQFPSLLTGIYAAHDLCGLGNYEDLTKPLRQVYHNSLAFRRAMEQLDNHQLNTVVKSLNGYWGEKLFQIKRVDPLKLAGYLLRPMLWKKAQK